MAVVEQFIRGSDNIVKLTLTEDGTAITGAWTGLSVYVGGIAITRAADGNGVALSTSTGILTISPGDLTAPEVASLATLEANHLYPVQIVVTSSANDDGAVWQPPDARILFHITDKPA